MGEELRPRLHVGADVRDVDRHVAHHAHTALGRVGAKRTPLALEAHLVGERSGAGEPHPPADPVGLPGHEVLDLCFRDPSLRLREQPARARERRARAIRRFELVRRTERQHLPPGLAGRREPVDQAVRLLVEHPVGRRRRVEENAG